MSELKKLTLAQISQHNKTNDCWLVVDNKVYDVTHFLEKHPGGKEVLLQNAGKDGTSTFKAMPHPPSARTRLESMCVGILDG
ncbi:cytochrome b5-like heme/steroid binding domain-containing protein [Polychytrium aggregatum]|uniref:cytochrome b5-like heme/steroid binding domain-containing protein n=1 Tax=Polychytrium aggregatum TaxID=110093 RepID=UPI0022FEBFA1|nr:cytochrome b5-like heme/steroid binding domain-containing protein [Polychytrium aggregatum]KAI9208324.1 cytochrome b5-like heme/steroid binding domain-containing protein [Polychytrium aggregatum]